MQVDRADLVVGNLCVSDIMYADDVGLMSTQHNQVQDLLNCLDII